nr:transcriptional regulator [Chloroflexia bacterium]
MAKTTPSVTSPVAVPVAPLHGRDDDLARIRSLLDSGQVRLLTLVGPGGFGKTRLSDSVVAAIAKDYADGAVTIPLAPLQDAGEVLLAASRHCDAPIEGD